MAKPAAVKQQFAPQISLSSPGAKQNKGKIKQHEKNEHENMVNNCPRMHIAILYSFEYVVSSKTNLIIIFKEYKISITSVYCDLVNFHSEIQKAK